MNTVANIILICLALAEVLCIAALINNNMAGNWVHEEIDRHYLQGLPRRPVPWWVNIQWGRFIRENLAWHAAATK